MHKKEETKNMAKKKLLKSRRKGLSIFGKLNLILLLSAVLIFVGLSSFTYFKSRKNIDSEIQSLAQFMADNLSVSLAMPLWNFDLNTSAKTLEAAMLDKQVYAILVRYEDNIQIGKIRNDQWKIIDTDQEISGDYYSISTDVTIDGQNLGTVDIYLTPKFMMQELTRSLINMLIGFISVTTLFLLCLFISIRLWVVKPIAKTAYGISEGIDQIDDYSSQISTSIQSLADSASQQASSSQSATTSLGNLSEMVRQIASSANRTDQMMQQAIETVKLSSNSMEKLNSSIEDISASGQRISTLVKTIDEIAFQTNLLALNAAVEAARAGESGRGFCVVANEVKNLASRASEAANLAAGVVEDTQRKIAAGGKMATETISGFRETDNFITNTGELSSQISVTTEEQVVHLDQISQTVYHADLATQKNAATSEEIASASQELKGLVLDFKSFVDTLMKLIGQA